jgi:hypothetical protein
MKKLNTLHPWLPQEYPKPLPSHPSIDKEVEQAKRRAKQAEKELAKIKKKYLALRRTRKGPDTLERIEVIARHLRARMECTEAKSKLRTLLAIQRARKK